MIAAWVLVAAGIFAAGRVAGTAFVDDFRIPSAEAQAALDLLRERFPEQAGATATVVFRAREGTLAEPEAMQAIRSTLARIAALPHVVRVDDPTRPGGQAGVSPDRTIAFSTIHYERSISELGRPAAERLVQVVASVRRPDLQVEAGGGPLVGYTHLPEPRGAEAVGLTAAVIVLFVAFGSLVAMGLPIATALVGLGTSLALVRLLSHVTDVPTLTPTLATMLALGVGIDYALFIVTRYREGLQRGEPVAEAVGRAIATSGQAVLFAGFTVAIWGLWVSGIPFIGMIGTVASISIAVAVLAALTLLPALLGAIGPRIDALGLPRLRHRVDLEDRGIWARWARTVARHPWPALVAGLTLIGVLAAPVVSMRFGLETGVSGKGSTQARAVAFIERGFGPGMTSPLLLLVELPRPGDVAPLQEIAGTVSADPDVVTLTEPVVAPDGGTVLFSVIPGSGQAEEATADLVRRLPERTLPPLEERTGADVFVGGETPVLLDLRDRVATRLPLLIAVVVALSLVLLPLLFRSVLVPVKAAVLNGLSIAAAYGAVVAVFQWGWGAALIGVDHTVAILSFVPMVMFAILFGLSMDYEGTTVKMIGFGLAVAVLIDATVVRIVLVPATMVLLGHANRWIPRWLERVRPPLHIEGERAFPGAPGPARVGGSASA